MHPSAHRDRSRTLAARTLSIVGHPALLMPAAVAAGAAGAGASPRLLQVALSTAVAVAVIVGMYSLWQVRAGSWAHVDASHPRERRQLNLFLAALLGGAAALLWAMGQPMPVVSGPLLAALLVLLAHLLRRWLKVSLHAAFAAFAAALVWPHLGLTPAFLALAAGVAWSRLVLRRHTLAEVLLGLLLGAAFGAAFRLLVV
jgi:hypothetical protein